MTMDSIIILDDDDEEGKSGLSGLSSTSSCKLPRSSRTNTPTHITQSPFASAEKASHVLQKENEKLFEEFVEHCTPRTVDCPEVLTFLQTKHAKASPDFLCSIEFRNSLGRCLTKAQKSTAKTFVYINELCTLLKQHSAKRRQATLSVTSGRDEASAGGDAEETGGVDMAVATPSTSGAQAEEDSGGNKKTKRASKKQIAYLENLLKVYNDEIRHLQEKELSIDEMEEEDSSYIQEHKLKKKMMKIYNKLCELKDCTTLTGRVIEQRISYKGTRYPEINKKIERYINNPDVRWKPPDYRDILELVQKTNNRQGLSLSRAQVAQIAQGAFQDTGSRLQERRHQDMVFNFGSHLTDRYQPNKDPALSDPLLARSLRSNRERALSGLEEVISKYAMRQDDTEEEERKKRQRNNQKKEQTNGNTEGHKSEEEDGDEEEEEEDEEDEVSSDPDIEEEIQASQEGDEEEEENDQAADASDQEVESSEGLPSVKSSVPGEGEDEEEEEELEMEKEEGEDGGVEVEEPAGNPPQLESPSQSEAQKSEDNQWQRPISPSPPMTANAGSQPPSPEVVSTHEDLTLTSVDTKLTNGQTSPLSPADLQISSRLRRKRGRSTEVETETNNLKRQRANSMSGSDSDIPLDMGVASSPLQADSTCADTQEMVSSSQMTPPPKSNKVDVATQCDPEECIVLSDSE